MLRALRVHTNDLASSILFGRDALGLSLSGAPVPLTATLSEGACCALSLYAGGGGEAGSGGSGGGVPAVGLGYPFLTYGVSNLRTSARHARRHGGVGLGEVGAGEALFSLPGARPGRLGGGGVRLLHAFRRNPAISVTLGVGDPGAAAQFFCAALGMRVLEGEEAALACPRPARGALVLVGPTEEPHNTTSLVLEASGCPGARAAEELPQGGKEAGFAGMEEAGEEGGEATLVLSLPDTARALRVCRELGLPTTAPSARGSFLAILSDGGYSLYCTPSAQ
jgi:catechol 2,3-dioxygenase-like lactoylglutathione lyase family enzyme